MPVTSHTSPTLPSISSDHVNSSIRFGELCPHSQEVEVGPQSLTVVSTGEFSVSTGFEPLTIETHSPGPLSLMVCLKREGLLKDRVLNSTDGL